MELLVGEKTAVGYVLDERCNKWKIQLEGSNNNGDCFFWMWQLEYNDEKGVYLYNNKELKKIKYYYYILCSTLLFLK